jgi:hypothetical protein
VIEPTVTSAAGAGKLSGFPAPARG